MRTTRTLRSLVSAGLGCALLAVGATAGAQPASMPVQGFLADGGGVAVDAASLPVTFRLYRAATGGSPFFTELANVPVNEGRFLYYLGETAALDLAQFDGSQVFVGVSVAGGAELTPRIPMGTVAYAARAGSVPFSGITGLPASLADGDQDTTYTAASPLVLNLGTNTFGLSTTGCDPGETWVWNGSAWTCSPAGGTTYTGGSGISVVGAVVSINASPCGVGNFSRWDGTQWRCEADASGLAAVNGGAGVAVTTAGGTATVSITSPTCGASEYSRWDGTQWRCVADATPSYTAGSGISINTGVIGIQAPTCVSGQASSWNGTQWTCVNDSVGLSDVTGTAPIAVSGSGSTRAIALSSTGCSAGQFLSWSGSAWQCASALTGLSGGSGITVSGGTVSMTGLVACVAGQRQRWTGSAWVCETDATGITALTAGAGIGVSGTTISVSSPTCSAGQFSFWNGSSWECRGDAITTVAGGDGIVVDTSGTTRTVRTSAPACSATQVSRWTGSAWTCVENADVTDQMALRANVNITGGGRLSYSTNGRFDWTGRMIVIGNGGGAGFSPQGYFDIGALPDAGTVQGAFGTPSQSIFADGVPIPCWQSLYYILPIGVSHVFDVNNLRIVEYWRAGDIPAEWVLLAQQNCDYGTLLVNTDGGVTLRPGQARSATTSDAGLSANSDCGSTLYLWTRWPSWGQENGWALLDSQGAIRWAVWPRSGHGSGDFAWAQGFESGNYTLRVLEDFGDGWDGGGYFNLHIPGHYYIFGDTAPWAWSYCWDPDGGGSLGCYRYQDFGFNIPAGTNNAQSCLPRGTPRRVIAGTVQSDGQILGGTGFTVWRIDTGLYRIYFTDDFTWPYIPSATATQVYPNSQNHGYPGSIHDDAILTGVSHWGLTIATGDGGGNRANRDFSFIAVGASD